MLICTKENTNTNTNDVLQKQNKPLSPDEGQCSSDFPSIRKKKQKQKGVIT